jgi:hypothetical protein
MCHKYCYYKIYILPKFTKHLTLTNIQSNESLIILCQKNKDKYLMKARS